MKHLLERGVIVLNVLEEPLLGEMWCGQGLCVGLDISLHEIGVLGLITCKEVGVVKRVHLLSGEVRRVATALKVVEEVQEEAQEVKDEREEEEAEGNGGLKVEGEPHTSCVNEMTCATPLSQAVHCVNHDDTNLTNKQESLHTHV